jgi:hypothetical protein
LCRVMKWKFQREMERMEAFGAESTVTKQGS